MADVQTTITHSTALLSHRVQVLRNLFQGRVDTYGLCVAGSPLTAKSPIREVDFKSHINGGRIRIGIFPLVEGRVHWAAIDIDREVRDAVSKICYHLREIGFFPHIERSKSKGYHVWIFFDDWISAKIVRTILTMILKRANLRDLELFPKQDDAKFGNYVFLPLHGSSIKEGRTVFVNPDFTDIDDQWRYLETACLTKTEGLDALSIDTAPSPSVGEEWTSEPLPEEESDSEPLFNVSKYLSDRNISFTVKSEPGRTFYQLAKCFWAEQHTTNDGHGDSAVIQDSSGRIGFHCFHQHCQRRSWHDVRAVLDGATPRIEKAGGIVVRSIDDVLAYPDPEYIIDPVLGKGLLYMLGGKAGRFKTLITWEMIKSVLTKEPLWGKYPVQIGGPVIMIDEETPRSIFKDRVVKMNFNKSWPLYIIHFQNIRVDNRSVLHELMNIIQKINPVLVTFDSLIRLHNKQENSAGEMESVWDCFRAIANLGPATWIIHHHKKGDGPTDQRARGSSENVAAIDVEYTTDYNEANKEIWLSSSKTRVAPFEKIVLAPTFKQDSISILYAGKEDERIEDTLKRYLREEENPMLPAYFKKRFEEDKFPTISERRIVKMLKALPGVEVIKDGKKNLYSFD